MNVMNRERRKDKPVVATALNKPFAIRSISPSIWGSVDEGELRMAYVDKGVEGLGMPSDVGVGGGGRREKREGEGDIKDKYWSMT